MDLKGGIAYLNMRGMDVHTTIDANNSVFVAGLYKDAINVIKSKKICVIYNAGAGLRNVPIPVTGYNVSDGILMFRISTITSNNIYTNKRICVKPDSSYYVTAA